MFKIIITTKNNKPVKNAIDRKVMVWETREMAQKFANSMTINFNIRPENMGRRAPKLEVVAA